AFYTGAIGDKLIEGLQKNGSLMAKKDLEIYEAMERTPIKTTYHGYEVVTVPPPSNGGDWLLEMLNIMENYDLKAMGFNSPEYIFTFNEASRLGLSDSYAFIGDPAFYKLPIDQMISKEYAKERVKLMPTDKAFPTPPPAGDLPVEKLNPATAPDSLHTSHVAVIDQFGNVVSTTNTLGNGWGCKYMAEGLGFFLNSHINNLDHEHPDSPDYVMPGKRVR
ncbi:MAG: gamma-glutamyltransferase, partial [Oscillospiraceae bacterium]